MSTPAKGPDASVDEYLHAFEVVWANDRPADLASFLPEARHPCYLEVLRELVRIDLELGWRHGQPRPLEDYLHRYPDLAGDPQSLQEVAFEEYRQRWLAGQFPLSSEYAERFGVSTAGWCVTTPKATRSPGAPAATTSGSAEFIVAEPGASLQADIVIPGGRTVVGLAALTTGPSDELSTLLQRRLSLTGMACTIVFAYFAILVLLNPDQKVSFSLGHGYNIALNGLALLTCAVLTALLWLRPRLPVDRLRAIELALFGLVLGNLGWSFSSDLFFEHELDLPMVQGDHALFHYGSSWSLPFFALIVSYGVLIPSTFRRCAFVVGAMAILPLTVAVAAGVVEGAFTTSYLQSFVLQMGLWLAGAAAIALYGSHRLESLRREVFAARQLGQYRLKRRLGAGGMGEVYLAEHVLLRRACAVKVIRPDRAGDPATRQRFEREVQVMATLRHPNTVQIYDYGHAADGTFYYVMEYLPGLNLEQVVRQHGPLSPEQTVHLLLQICGALRESHAAGLVHRDIKPSNIMTYEQSGLRDVAKLLDFGLVRVPIPPGRDRLTDMREIAGTPAYMSPEQATGKEGIDARTDIYSLGAVAYFLLTGKPPFACETALETLAAHLHTPPLPPDHLRSGLPADLQAVILRCLEKEGEKRYPNVTELEKALSRCACAGRWTDQGPASEGLGDGTPAAP